MTLSPERISELKELAGKATPGPWRRASGTANYRVYGQFREVASAYQVKHGTRAGDVLVEADGRANASYIAAIDPATLLALLSAFEEMTLYDGHPAVIVREMADRIEALERERDEARAACVALRDERDNLSSIVSSGIDDVAGAALDDAETALAASQAEVTRLKALREMHRRAQ